MGSALPEKGETPFREGGEAAMSQERLSRPVWFLSFPSTSTHAAFGVNSSHPGYPPQGFSIVLFLGAAGASRQGDVSS